LQAFTDLRGPGAPTDHAQDLLRAALVFAAAGVDALVKQLVRDTLPSIVDQDIGARQQFREYVKTALLRKEQLDIDLLADVLLADNGTEQLKAKLCRDLTSNSLQSHEQLLKVASFFAITPASLVVTIPELKAAFAVRNQISHEMDVDIQGTTRKRRSRKFSNMKAEAEKLITVGLAFYNSVAQRLSP